MTSKRCPQFARWLKSKPCVLPLFLVIAGLGLLGATLWTKQASVLFSGLLVVFSGLLWKTNRDFNRWSRDQYEPKPGIVGGELSHDNKDVTIHLEMINPGQAMIFYTATKLNECPIRSFFANDLFENNIGIKPYEVVKVSLKSPIKGAVAELDRFLEDSDRFLLDIDEAYYSGKELDGQHVWNITFRKKDREWKIMPSFLSDVKAAERKKEQ